MTFETAYIKIDEQGISLLKNYRVSQHLDYSEINQVEVKRGHLIARWAIPLAVGLLVIAASAIIMANTFQVVDIRSIGSLTFRNFFLLEISPLILLAGGIFLTYQSFRKCEVIVISTAATKHQVALKEFERKNGIQEVVQFLSDRTTVVNTKR